MSKITFSHSKMNLLLEDIYSYFLNYIYKISPYEKSNALTIGEAVHYALETGSSDLTSFFKEHGTLFQKNGYSYEQALSESLSLAYFSKKDEILNEIVGDATVLEEFREFKIEVDLQKNQHKFLGIVDLLLKTDKGFIVIDYKTTSKNPNFSEYLEQLYKYCFLIKYKFNQPIYKIAIINLRKASLRQKANEDGESFKRRLVLDYKERVDEYITYKVFNNDDEIFNEKVLNDYYSNLEDMIELCSNLLESKTFPVNYSKAHTVYGQSQFYDFIYWNDELIKSKFYINDKFYNEETEEIENRRKITDFDLEIIKTRSKEVIEKTIFTYDKFLKVVGGCVLSSFDIEELSSKYLIDPQLIENYIKVYKMEAIVSGQFCE